ncbi:MAG: phosphatidylglycerophosphatase A [Comamonadaceae bacterium]|nr:phosphatidylglycerophosphatase A [Comamonadaceae bacterium]
MTSRDKPPWATPGHARPRPPGRCPPAHARARRRGRSGRPPAQPTGTRPARLGLAWAPGTVGTLWAWLAWLVLSLWLSPLQLGVLIAGSTLLGWWACTVTADHLGVLDPGNIVWDEVVAFWLVLWLLMPTGFWGQLVAFALFRFFDAVKPGPVRWADEAFHGTGWRGGFGILLDDFVAAFCTLMVIAVVARLVSRITPEWIAPHDRSTLGTG